MKILRPVKMGSYNPGTTGGGGGLTPPFSQLPAPNGTILGFDVTAGHSIAFNATARNQQASLVADDGLGFAYVNLVEVGSGNNLFMTARPTGAQIDATATPLTITAQTTTVTTPVGDLHLNSGVNLFLESGNGALVTSDGGVTFLTVKSKSIADGTGNGIGFSAGQISVLPVLSVDSLAFDAAAVTKVVSFTFGTINFNGSAIDFNGATLNNLGALSVNLGGGGQFLSTSAAMPNGSGASIGTLTNAPAAGNPTKWIPISDNGTIRQIPAW